MQIYLARNQVQAGPYTLEQLNTMLASEQVDLNDLVWHEGMAQWQRVGTLTGEQRHYAPDIATTSSVSVAAPNADSKKSADKSPTRTTVAELYGNKEPVSTDNSSDTSSDNPFDKSKQPKSIIKGSALNKVRRPDGTGLAKAGENDLASVSSRVLAVLIDQILFLVCLIPLMSGIDFDFEKVEKAGLSMSAMTALVESIPQHLLIMTSLLFIGILVVQIFMLIRRGQSLGKLITGVRILDVNSKRLPSVTNIVLLRTLLTNLAYNLPYIGQFILVLDLIMMVVDKQRRSLHDKLAKTIVVKAKPEQLNKI